MRSTGPYATAEASEAPAWRELRAVVAEALALQSLAERLLRAISDRHSSAEAAAGVGPVLSRLVALRRELPSAAEPELRRYVEIVDAVLQHHAVSLSSALDRLFAEPPPAQPTHESRTGVGLGPAGRWLETVSARLDGHG